MTGRIALILAAVLTFIHGARGGEKQFHVVLKGNLTTGSQLFPNPESTDEVKRSSRVFLDNSLGYGLELRYIMPEINLAVGAGAEYIKTTTSFTNFVSGNRSYQVEDGYQVIPVEVTGYFIIPLSGPFFGIYMGGGGGMYLGRRLYSIGGVAAGSVDLGHGFGIHVLGGISLALTETFSVIAEMKFRDLQFESSNAFPVSTIRSNGNVITVPTSPFPSRVHTDGIVFQLGTALRW